MRAIVATTLPTCLENDSIYTKCLQYISDETRNRLSNYREHKDSLRSAVGEILVRTLLYKLFSIRNYDIHIARGAYGKPYLLSNKSIHFNISHSHNLVVCVIDSLEVGIDVEFMRPVELCLARRFFHPSEYQKLCKVSSAAYRTKLFFDIWTMKESYIKMDGRGLSLSLKAPIVDIEHLDLDSQDPILLEGNYYTRFTPLPNYRLCVCSKSKDFSVVEIIGFQHLLNLFKHINENV